MTELDEEGFTLRVSELKYDVATDTWNSEPIEKRVTFPEGRLSSKAAIQQSLRSMVEEARQDDFGTPYLVDQRRDAPVKALRKK
jgi:hypothetical protein